MSLSDLTCMEAKAKDKRYKLFDSNGLYLEVMPSGNKYWRLKYRIHNLERHYSIGNYPIVSLEEAQNLSSVVRSAVLAGNDPALEKRMQKQTELLAASQTFESIALEWHGTNNGFWDERYAQTVLYRLEKYVFSELGPYPLRLLKATIVLACLHKIEKCGPDLCRRMKRVISQIFRYAIATGRMEHDLTYGLEAALKRYKRSHFASIDIEELPELLVCLENHRNNMHVQTYMAIKLMALTFVRTRELTQARWSEFDLDRAMWSIPAERMKMKLPHLVPLSKQSVCILKQLYEMNGKREHVFPGRVYPRKPVSAAVILVALKRMGYGGRMTGHGFRALAMGIAKEKLNISHDVIDRQLAHVPKSSTDRAYDRAKLLPQRIDMMQKFANYIDTAYLNEISKCKNVKDWSSMTC